ncbi:MAG: class I SAM-dependent methyltransferase [Ferrimicrobium sp.]
MPTPDLPEIRDDVYAEATYRAIQASGLKSGESIADIGCGNGMLAVAYARIVGKSGRVWAVDSDPDRRAEVATQAALFSQILAVTQSVEDLALAEKPDVIAERFLLIGVHDIPRALARMMASVRPGGTLIIQEPVTSAGRVGTLPLRFESGVVRHPDAGINLVPTLISLGGVVTDLFATMPASYGDGPVANYLAELTGTPPSDNEVILLPPLITTIVRAPTTR